MNNNWIFIANPMNTIIHWTITTGQLCTGNNKPTKKLVEPKIPPEISIQQLAVGYDHTIILTGKILISETMNYYRYKRFIRLWK